MKLNKLLNGINILQTIGNDNLEINALTIDSRKADSDSLFIAIKGTLTDGHKYIDNVITNGTKAIICQDLPQELNNTVCYIQVKDTAAIAGIVADNFYNHPTHNFKLVGVTGTNGKTTVATLLFQLFTALGYKCGLVSTVQNQIDEKVIPATHTTPDAISLQSLFAQMQTEECEYVFMEVSSHAIHQHRIAGANFDGGIFTNITHDHLDYHKTFEEYINVKKSFFDHLPKSAFAITNIDDKRGGIMLQNTKAERKTYSLRTLADFKAKILENSLSGLLLSIDKQEVHFRLTGLFNAYNLLAVYGAATMLGENKTEVLAVLSNLKGAKGRFESYRSTNENIIGIIDYAHTPDALLNVLLTIKQFHNHNHIITVVGCGGDRDTTKRPEMTEVACEHSNKVILTSDNPRSEDPEAILNDMENGINPKYKRKIIRITNRSEAIKTACSLAGKDDVILIAGKGHENYQEVKGIKHHFDDKEELLKMFELLEK